MLVIEHHDKCDEHCANREQCAGSTATKLTAGGAGVAVFLNHVMIGHTLDTVVLSAHELVAAASMHLHGPIFKTLFDERSVLSLAPLDQSLEAINLCKQSLSHAKTRKVIKRTP